MRDVTELSLTGLADPEPWAELVAREGLRLHVVEGRAPVLLLGCSTTFKGIRFREVSVSAFVSDSGDGSTRDGAFMVQAFNSVRFFAFVERRVFKTPYEFADVRVSADDAVAMSVRKRDELVVRAEMTGPARETAPGEDGWEGPIFLPRPAGNRGKRKVFFAKLEGASRSVAFRDADRLEFGQAAKHPVFGLLTASRFAPQAWQYRTGAVHSRTKSFAR
ncbi:MAG: hypothetical protein ACYTCU_06560 [Planctomycetota bacterium]